MGQVFLIAPLVAIILAAIAVGVAELGAVGLGVSSVSQPLRREPPVSTVQGVVGVPVCQFARITWSQARVRIQIAWG